MSTFLNNKTYNSNTTFCFFIYLHFTRKSQHIITVRYATIHQTIAWTMGETQWLIFEEETILVLEIIIVIKGIKEL